MLKQRFLTAVVAVIVLLSVLFVASPDVARAVIGLLFAAAAWEWSGFFANRSTPVRGLYVALVAIGQVCLWYLLPDTALYSGIALTAAAWWFLALIWLSRFPTPVPEPVVWLCGFLTLLPAYAAMDWLYLRSPVTLLALLLVVWLADIGAYFAGRRFGRVKLAPNVSPGKTWEGVIGGLSLVVIATSVAAFYLGYSAFIVLPFCAALALLSVVGDLTVSLFKRHAGVKDSGSLFPGHGGILDRIDSVCAAAPLFAFGLVALGL